MLTGHVASDLTTSVNLIILHLLTKCPLITLSLPLSSSLCTDLPLLLEHSWKPLPQTLVLSEVLYPFSLSYWNPAFSVSIHNNWYFLQPSITRMYLAISMRSCAVPVVQQIVLTLQN